MQENTTRCLQTIQTTATTNSNFNTAPIPKGPFETFTMDQSKTKMTVPWQPTSVEFSGDGSNLLLATDHDVIMRLDGFEGDLVRNLYLVFLCC